MKRTAQLLVISALLSYSMAVTGSIKERLSQINTGNNLVELEAEQGNDLALANCTLGAMPPLTLNCPCTLSVPTPVV